MKRYVAKARYPLIVLLAALSVVLFVQIRAMQQARARAFYPDPEPGDVAVSLTRVGLDAEALAAAGVSPTATDALVADAHEHLVVNTPALAAADAAFADARRACDGLRRLIQAGGATAQDLSDYTQALADRAQAETQRQSLLDGLVTAATTGLDGSQVATLAAIRGNRHWDLPLEFLVLDRTEAEWVLIRKCLANERIAAEWGEPPDAGSQAALTQFRAHPDVAIARVNLDVSLDAVSAAWEAAVDQPGG